MIGTSVMKELKESITKTRSRYFCYFILQCLKDSRDVLRILSNIYDGVCGKCLAVLTVDYFYKKLHYRCSTGSSIRFLNVEVIFRALQSGLKNNSLENFFYSGTCYKDTEVNKLWKCCLTYTLILFFPGCNFSKLLLIICGDCNDWGKLIVLSFTEAEVFSVTQISFVGCLK